MKRTSLSLHGLIKHRTHSLIMAEDGRSVSDCPFHSRGNRGTLSISKDGKMWHCSACKAGGDVMRWLELVGFDGVAAQIQKWTTGGSHYGVYFLRNGGRIKIGTTGRRPHRLRELARRIAGKAHAIGWITATDGYAARQIERILHEAFDMLCPDRRAQGKKREWFLLGHELLDFVREYAT